MKTVLQQLLEKDNATYDDIVQSIPFPLHEAVITEDLESVNQLVAMATAEQINAENYNGYTSLHLAAIDGHTEIAKSLIENNANVDAQDKDEFLTPLHCAAHKGHKDIAKLLIEKGANINAKDHNSYTPLHWATEKGHPEVAKLLIEKGANVNAQDKNGCTPMHRAAIHGHKGIIELLIKKGANVKTKDVCHYTPLQWATNKGHKDIVELFNQTEEQRKTEEQRRLAFSLITSFSAMSGSIGIMYLMHHVGLPKAVMTSLSSEIGGIVPASISQGVIAGAVGGLIASTITLVYQYFTEKDLEKGKLLALNGLVAFGACSISATSVTSTLLLTTDVATLISVQIAVPVVLAILQTVVIYHLNNSLTT